MPSQTQLQAAFYRSGLKKLGYTLESAMQNKALAICLNRLAAIHTKPAPVAKQYWFNNI